MKIKVLICWSDISGYMASCWKALNKTEAVELEIIAFEHNTQTSFGKDLTKGLNVHFVDRSPSQLYINHLTLKINPDIIVICGWFIPAYRSLVSYKELKKNTKFILAMDTPWWGTIKQHLGRFLLKSFVAKMDAVVTSGERSYQYARRLGAKKAFKFQYGVDTEYLKKAYTKRLQLDHWPHQFLFVGRYVAVKSIDTLVDAYKEYRKKVNIPWELHACGQGPMESLLTLDGITNHGFVQPDDMMPHWINSGCLVLSSTFDPWPLIVVEACAAGLPVIVTHASGSQVEVVKMYYNGIVINESSVTDMSSAMLWIHNNANQLSAMGERSLEQAKPYGADLWAEKFNELIKYL